MGLILKRLELCDFRNHQSFLINEPQKLIIIVGRNATGKTNIIEALQLVSMLESFRNPYWQNVVNNNHKEASIQAQFLQNERLIDIRMDIKEGKRVYSLNGKKRVRTALQGLIPAVVFIPDDLSLVKDSSEIRRKLLDDIGQQLSSTYRDILTEYQKTVRQRNVILKEQKESTALSLVLESWDENLFSLGASLFVHRIKLYGRLIEKASEFYAQFSDGETITSTYVPSFSCLNKEYTNEELIALTKEQIRELLQHTREYVRGDEWARGKTLVGPHRDEIVFFIGNHEARRYGSQGQQRSIALSLKLAQLAIIQEISGNQPILLLDDVMSELDEKRRSALVEVLVGQMQTIITATDLTFFSEKLLATAQIIELTAPERI
jgi:DNA replication and repair protein RecF